MRRRFPSMVLTLALLVAGLVAAAAPASAATYSLSSSVNYQRCVTLGSVDDLNWKLSQHTYKMTRYSNITFGSGPNCHSWPSGTIYLRVRFYEPTRSGCTTTAKGWGVSTTTFTNASGRTIATNVLNGTCFRLSYLGGSNARGKTFKSSVWG